MEKNVLNEQKLSKKMRNKNWSFKFAQLRKRICEAEKARSIKKEKSFTILSTYVECLEGKGPNHRRCF